MAEWKEYKIKELGTVITGKTPPTNERKYYGGVIPFICIPDLTKGKYIYSSSKTLTTVGAEVVKNCILPKGSIMVSCIATIGAVGITSQEESVTNQQINSLVPNKNIIDTEFIYYYFKNLGEDLAQYGGGGSIFEIISKEKFSNISILSPILPEQAAIAFVLSSLDDKIDLLHRQNKTVEQLAETLFRQWFVEEAKESWKESSLFDVVEILGGGTPKTEVAEYWSGDIHWISGKDITPNHKQFIISTEKRITKKGLENSSTRILPKFSTVISTRGTVGKTCILASPMAFSQTNYGIVPRYKDCYFFTYLLIEYSIEELQSASYGTVFDTITTNTFREHKINIPSEVEIKVFEEKVRPYFEKMLLNINQIHTLTHLRDTLLPKLMSGEVGVKGS